jgi:hypothetical protein
MPLNKYLTKVCEFYFILDEAVMGSAGKVGL